MIFRVFFINNEDYPNANEVSLSISVEKMPQSLLKFICWLIDEKAYKAASAVFLFQSNFVRNCLTSE
jgi:hypothetical protein